MKVKLLENSAEDRDTLDILHCYKNNVTVQRTQMVLNRANIPYLFL